VSKVEAAFSFLLKIFTHIFFVALEKYYFQYEKHFQKIVSYCSKKSNCFLSTKSTALVKIKKIKVLYLALIALI
jgi:hypothetical protein